MDQVLYDIQKILTLMIPEKWERIDLYASVVDKNDKDIKGELFFYFMPKSNFNKEYINCYEIPWEYNIDEMDYLEYINKLYNLIKKLRIIYFNEENKLWSSITISIDGKKSTCKFELNYENLLNTPFTSFERHVIWRYINLNIIPKIKEEKNIIEKYTKYITEYTIPKEFKYTPLKVKPTQNIVDYGKVRNLD